MEDMTKEELIAMFHKVRTQTMQIAKEKKQAVEGLEVCTKEKEDIRSKALVIIQRCKDLEEKQAANSVFKAKCESYAILFEEQTQKINDYESRLEEKTKALHHLEDIVNRSPEHYVSAPAGSHHRDADIQSYQDKISSLETAKAEVEEELQVTLIISF